MIKRSYRVRAIWDPEARVYYAESDITGLHIESASRDEFEEVLLDVAPELIIANHLDSADAGKPLQELMPAILWERPAETAA